MMFKSDFKRVFYLFSWKHAPISIDWLLIEMPTKAQFRVVVD